MTAWQTRQIQSVRALYPFLYPARVKTGPKWSKWFIFSVFGVHTRPFVYKGFRMVHWGLFNPKSGVSAVPPRARR
jgi:hypothetical protein